MPNAKKSAPVVNTIEREAVSFRSPLRYPGGKQKAIAKIAARFPRGQVKEYREPLMGGASVFLHARSLGFAQRYWINDLFDELVCFWRTIQDDTDCLRLIDELKEVRRQFTQHESEAEQVEAARRYFYLWKNKQVDDDFRKALLFFFFNRVTFSGTTRAGGFSSAASLKRFTDSSIERLRLMPRALKDVTITRSDFEDVIVAPGEDVFMFLDPPYYTATRLYGREGSLHQFDHERLAAALKKCKHRFLITYDDCPEIRRLYKFARLSRFQLQYGMNNCNLDNLSKVGNELFIANY